jgi:tRNA G26 N,N-dimethylase Trm1
LIFANAVGNEYYVDDFVMGEWLWGQLAQDVANDVERVMGRDSSGTSIYRFCSASVLDTHLLGSIYASQLTDHHFIQEMQRGQRSDENPQQYVCEQVKKAYKIAHTNQAPQQYLCSQIYEGFTPLWK